MNPVVIALNNVSKKYVLKPEHTHGGYTLKERFTNAILRNKTTLHGNLDNKELWALKNISFNVHKGDILGIIGSNGAGKSTLLKILSNITKPTEGTITIHGKVTSILEIGSGFHPELTGRENVYFNGAITGLKRNQIEIKFGEIVSFAGLEKFIDIPIKFYSAGMTARLSFAVALFLKPEILIIDEALAVGDAEFQQTSFDYFTALANSGVTIVMASHDTELLRRMATVCIHISNGTVKEFGDSNTVISNYLKESLRKKKSQHSLLFSSDMQIVRKQYNKRFDKTLRDWLIYYQQTIHFTKSTWMGVTALKNPLDSWMYQQILYEVKPDIVIEIGSNYGGGTLYLAHILDAIGNGKVISIDEDRSTYNATHPRIHAITGGSQDKRVIETVRELCKKKTVLIIHDGNHQKNAVEQDLLTYSPLVSPESYFIVEDGIIDLFSPNDSIGSNSPGPLCAISAFLQSHKNFSIDTEREHYILTYNPHGFLKRLH